MKKYYQKVTPDVNTETWSFIPAGTNNDYSKYITEDDIAWEIMENTASEGNVRNIEGVAEITEADFDAYFLPGSRPPHKP